MTALETTSDFPDFVTFWAPFTLGAGPAPGYCKSLPPERQAALKDELRRRLGSERTNNEEWSAYLYVDDVDTHHEAVKATGVEIVYPLEDQFYGCRDYTIRDPDGHLIAFGQEID